MREVAYSADQVIYREGDTPDLVYRILGGEVEILKSRGEDNQTLLAVLGEGEIFGEMGVVSGKKRIASAIARSDVALQAMDRDEFLLAIETDSTLAMPLIQMLCERLSEMDRRFTEERVVGEAVSIEQCASLHLGPACEEMEEIMGVRMIQPSRLPFTMGRRRDKGEASASDMNDFELPDDKPFQLSRNHFSIETKGGVLVIQDRGSLLGTVVNGQRIGVFEQSSFAALCPGDNSLIAGGKDSLFRFNLRVQIDKGRG